MKTLAVLIAGISLGGCVAPRAPIPREEINGHHAAIDASKLKIDGVLSRLAGGPISQDDATLLKDAMCSAYSSDSALGGSGKLNPCIEKTFYVPVAQQSTYVDAAKAVLVHDFKDPGSAQFRDERLSTISTGFNLPVLCGEVNAKNSYGAYTGFKKFVTTDSGQQVAIAGSYPRFFEIWDNHCRTK